MPLHWSSVSYPLLCSVIFSPVLRSRWVLHLLFSNSYYNEKSINWDGWVKYDLLFFPNQYQFLWSCNMNFIPFTPSEIRIWPLFFISVSYPLISSTNSNSFFFQLWAYGFHSTVAKALKSDGYTVFPSRCERTFFSENFNEKLCFFFSHQDAKFKKYQALKRCISALLGFLHCNHTRNLTDTPSFRNFIDPAFSCISLAHIFAELLYFVCFQAIAARLKDSWVE